MFETDSLMLAPPILTFFVTSTFKQLDSSDLACMAILSRLTSRMEVIRSIPVGADQSATVPKLLTVFHTCMIDTEIRPAPRSPLRAHYHTIYDIFIGSTEWGSAESLTSDMGAGMIPLVLTSTWDSGGNECCVNMVTSTLWLYSHVRDRPL